jgi:hypothetical protein
MTVHEVALRLNCSEQHVHSLIAKGRLSAFNISVDPGVKKAVWRIRPESVAAIENHAA